MTHEIYWTDIPESSQDNKEVEYLPHTSLIWSSPRPSFTKKGKGSNYWWLPAKRKPCDNLCGALLECAYIHKDVEVDENDLVYILSRFHIKSKKPNFSELPNDYVALLNKGDYLIVCNKNVRAKIDYVTDGYSQQEAEKFTGALFEMFLEVKDSVCETEYQINEEEV